MFLQTIIIMGVMLTLLTLVSTMGGAMNMKERFEEDSAADKGETGQLSGEILRATDRKMQEVSEEFDGDADGPAGGATGYRKESGETGGTDPSGGWTDPSGGRTAPAGDSGGGTGGGTGGDTGGGTGGDTGGYPGGGDVEPFEELVASWDPREDRRRG